MTGATVNATLALAALLILGVYGAGIWALTRIRTHRGSYRQGHNAGRVVGHVAGYRKAYAEQEILVDDLREEIDHLEQRMAELSRQQQRRAA